MDDVLIEIGGKGYRFSVLLNFGENQIGVTKLIQSSTGPNLLVEQ